MNFNECEWFYSCSTDAWLLFVKGWSCGKEWRDIRKLILWNSHKSRGQFAPALCEGDVTYKQVLDPWAWLPLKRKCNLNSFHTIIFVQLHCKPRQKYLISTFTRATHRVAASFVSLWSHKTRVNYSTFHSWDDVLLAIKLNLSSNQFQKREILLVVTQMCLLKCFGVASAWENGGSSELALESGGVEWPWRNLTVWNGALGSSLSVWKDPPRYSESNMNISRIQLPSTSLPHSRH